MRGILIYVACAIAIVTFVKFMGDDEASIQVHTVIRDCRDNATNVEPTYVQTAQNYNTLSDPNVLLAQQQRNVDGEVMLEGVIGLATLVCNIDVGEGNWYSNRSAETMQVLTLEAIRLGRELALGND